MLAVALCAQAPPPPTVAQILAHHRAALTALHLHDLPVYEETGTFEGLGLQGTFHEWKDGDSDRRDAQLGIRASTTLRIGDRIWVKDENGAVRELLGIAKRRQVTEDFIGSPEFVSEPQYSSYAGETTLGDGRRVYLLKVAPKGGEPYTVAIDAQSWLIVQLSYTDVDGQSDATLSDIRVVDGVIVPFVEVDSNGDSAYAVTGRVTSVQPERTIDKSVFAPLVANDVTNTTPVTVSFELRDGLPVVPVQIRGKTYHFLLDSGSQTDALDEGLVHALGLQPQGILEVSGAKRTASGGVVNLPGMSIGGATLPMHVDAVLDLSHMMRKGGVDGILGYPLFGAADVRIDPDARTLTIAAPGTLPAQGAKLDVDTDRGLSDVKVTIDGEPTRVLFDTGDANELLLFQSFLSAYPGLISSLKGKDERGLGIGGTINTRAASVENLTIGPYALYNRRAVVVLTSVGAFADRNDGGNVGYGTLQNFNLTFSLPNHAIYLQPDAGFDNGRFRVTH